MKKFIFTLIVILNISLTTLSFNYNNLNDGIVSPCSDAPTPDVNVG